MKRIFNINPVVNKKNGQINISLPKKQLPEALKKDPTLLRKMRFYMEGWDE